MNINIESSWLEILKDEFEKDFEEKNNILIWEH